MTRRKRILWVCLPLAVLVAGIGISLAVDYANKPENIFPMWQEALTPEGDDYPGVTLTLTGIDYDQPPRSEYDGPQDVFLIRAVIPGTRQAYGGMDRFVDYLYNGEWHTVWHNQVGECAVIYFPGENDIQVWVPASLFKLPGQYRIYVDTLGYCEYDNLMPGE